MKSPQPDAAPARIPIAALEPIGTGLHRPECVVADQAGDVFVSDWRGGVTRIASDLTQRSWLARDPAIELRPNGIALAPDGSFLLANLGDAGGVWRLRRTGDLEPFLTRLDGVPLPPSNFVLIDGERTWISVSTRHVRRHEAWRSDVADGFIVLVDRAGARIVADRLQYTNEVRPDPEGRWLYVVETFGRRLTRFRIGHDGTLSDREPVVTLGYGCFPDGFAFDADGTIWVTSLISNRLLRVRGAAVDVMLEDVNAGYVEAVERAFESGRMQREHLGPIPGTTIQQLTSVAFGGSKQPWVYLGTLHGACVYRFDRSLVR